MHRTCAWSAALDSIGPCSESIHLTCVQCALVLHLILSYTTSSSDNSFIQSQSASYQFYVFSRDICDGSALLDAKVWPKSLALATASSFLPFQLTSAHIIVPLLYKSDEHIVNEATLPVLQWGGLSLRGVDGPRACCGFVLYNLSGPHRY
jgi:hypothetical protein